MISEKVREYVKGNSFCPEYLFKDYETFLELLYAEGGRISAILWWDHCKISDSRLSIGSGGYKDPCDPDYMYAETQLYDDGLETKTLAEIKKHMCETRNKTITYNEKYTSFDLVPSFYLCE